MLRIALKPSPYLAISLSLGHLGALASVALVPLALWLKLALSLVLLLSLARTLRHDAWRSAPGGVELAVLAGIDRQLVRDQRRATRHLGRAIALGRFNAVGQSAGGVV